MTNEQLQTLVILLEMCDEALDSNDKPSYNLYLNQVFTIMERLPSYHNYLNIMQ